MNRPVCKISCRVEDCLAEILFFEFRVLASDDEICFATINQQEKLVTDYNTLAVTAYQRMYQALAVKARKEEVWGPLGVVVAVAELA